MYQYHALIAKIVDGDTFEIDIDLGLSIWVKNEKIRLYGVNTPEVYGVKKGSPEWEEGKKSSDFVKGILKKNDPVIVETMKDLKGKYGRYLAVLYANINPDIIAGLDQIRQIGEYFCVNDILVRKGLAKEYYL